MQGKRKRRSTLSLSNSHKSTRKWAANRQRSQDAGFSFEQLEERLALTVVINEFLASNDGGLEDLAGHSHDWIELKNTGVSTQNVAGWYLTDDLANRTKFQIPSAGALTTLDPGEILLVYASGNNSEVGLIGDEIHTNFQLSQEPGVLALVQSNGTTIVDQYNLYPQQTTDISYGVGIGVATHSTETETLVGDSSPVRVVSPTGPDAARDDHWKEIGYDDSAWLSGTGSVGFDRNSDSPNLLPYIGRVLSTGEMDSNDGSPQYSAYVRYEFDVTDKEQLTSLALDLRFDDGFIAYLNGREIARANFAEDFVYPQPQWNSYAGHQQGSSSSSGNWNRVDDADQTISFDLTPYLEFLEDEGNVLAFHGVNSRSGSSGSTNRLDFLIDAQLTAERAMGSQAVGYLAVPSPGRENGLAYNGYIADTNFSLQRGFYDTTQLLEITATEPNSIIRYTTDFSEPTLSNGFTYSSPISISTTTVVRAKAFKANFISTNVDTQTYLFLADVIQQNANDVTQPYATWGHDKEDEDNTSGYNLDDESDWEMDPQIVSGNETAVIDALKDIPTISVVTGWDNLWSGTPLPGTGQDDGRVAYEPQGIYIHGRSSERPNSLEYFTADDSGSFQVDSVFEIQGHSSPGRWNSDKLSFQVKFKAPLGDSKLNFDLFAGTPDGENAVDGFDTLILDAMYNYSWTHPNVSVQSDYARFVTDQVSADLQNLASGGEAAPHGKYVHLYLDGLYWGLYNIHERPDEHFAADYYGGNEDDFYVVKHSTNDIDGHEYTWVQGGLAAESAYDDLLNATRQNLAIPANYQAVEQLIDVDQFIDYMIVHLYAGNENDWPHNNWYATYDPTSPDGRWRFHAWDQEHAFPTNDNGDSFNQFVNLTDDNDTETPGEVFANLITSSEFRLRFSDRVQELMRNDGVLTPTRAQAAYEARTDEIDLAILAESARWGDNRDTNDPYTRMDFLNVKNGVLSTFFPVRTSVVLGQFDSAGNNWLVDDLAPEFNQYGGEISAGFGLTITNPNPSGTIWYTLDGSDPRNSATNGPSATAQSYSGVVTLGESTRVRARVFANSSGTANDWSAEVNKLFTLEEPLSLRIVELMYNPVGTNLEYIELLNTGNLPIELAGVRLTGFASEDYVFDSMTLGAGQRVVVPEDLAAFQAAYPGVTNVTLDAYSGNLSNGGEKVNLRDAFGRLLQSFTYDDSGDWPSAADGGGASLEYIGSFDVGENPLDEAGDPFDDGTNWQASVIGGTPGIATANDADFNDDQRVNGLDFLVWQRNLAATGATNAQGDTDQNGTVDAADLANWASQYGASEAPVAALQSLENSSMTTTFNGWIALPISGISSDESDLDTALAENMLLEADLAEPVADELANAIVQEWPEEDLSLALAESESESEGIELIAEDWFEEGGLV